MEKEIQNRFDRLESLLLQQKEVLTLDELVKYTGLERSYLLKLTSTNRIPFSKPTGKTLYFDKRKIDRWLLKNPVATNEEIEGRVRA